VDTQDHYAILGVPFNADAAAIRRAYRQRVKQIHPDVAADKTNANEDFIQLQEAYRVLSDPGKRTNYDVTYAARRRQANPRPASAGFGAQAGPSDTWSRHQSALTVAELLQRAMREMATGRNPYARRDLAAVLAREPENPDAILLLGRLYRSEGRVGEWVRVLEDGLAENPYNAVLRLALNEALKARHEDPFSRDSPEKNVEYRRRAYTAIGMMGAPLIFLWGFTHPGAPFNAILFMVDAPGHLLLCTLLIAALAGWTMASTGYIPPIDDELFVPETYGRSLKRNYPRNDAPLGLAVPVMALIHYLLAVGVIGALMLTRGTLSRSLITVSVLALGLTAAMAMACPPGTMSIWNWCPGWMLFAEFCGWFIGEFFRL
jgi:curved DNA-binding protein CbpA